MDFRESKGGKVWLLRACTSQPGEREDNNKHEHGTRACISQPGEREDNKHEHGNKAPRVHATTTSSSQVNIK